MLSEQKCWFLPDLKAIFNVVHLSGHTASVVLESGKTHVCVYVVCHFCGLLSLLCVCVGVSDVEPYWMTVGFLSSRSRPIINALKTNRPAHSQQSTRLRSHKSVLFYFLGSSKRNIPWHFQSRHSENFTQVENAVTNKANRHGCHPQSFFFFFCGPCYCACWLAVMVSRETSMEWEHHYSNYSDYNKSKCLLYEKVYFRYGPQTADPFVLHQRQKKKKKKILTGANGFQVTQRRCHAPWPSLSSAFRMCQNLPVWANTKEFLSNEESAGDAAFFSS